MKRARESSAKRLVEEKPYAFPLSVPAAVPLPCPAPDSLSKSSRLSSVIDYAADLRGVSRVVSLGLDAPADSDVFDEPRAALPFAFSMGFDERGNDSDAGDEGGSERANGRGRSERRRPVRLFGDDSDDDAHDAPLEEPAPRPATTGASPHAHPSSDLIFLRAVHVDSTAIAAVAPRKVDNTNFRALNLKRGFKRGGSFKGVDGRWRRSKRSDKPMTVNAAVISDNAHVDSDVHVDETEEEEADWRALGLSLSDSSPKMRTVLSKLESTALNVSYKDPIMNSDSALSVHVDCCLKGESVVHVGDSLTSIVEAFTSRLPKSSRSLVFVLSLTPTWLNSSSTCPSITQLLQSGTAHVDTLLGAKAADRSRVLDAVRQGLASVLCVSERSLPSPNALAALLLHWSTQTPKADVVFRVIVPHAHLLLLDERAAALFASLRVRLGGVHVFAHADALSAVHVAQLQRLLNGSSPSALVAPVPVPSLPYALTLSLESSASAALLWLLRGPWSHARPRVRRVLVSAAFQRSVDALITALVSARLPPSVRVVAHHAGLKRDEQQRSLAAWSAADTRSSKGKRKDNADGGSDESDSLGVGVGVGVGEGVVVLVATQASVIATALEHAQPGEGAHAALFYAELPRTLDDIAATAALLRATHVHICAYGSELAFQRALVLKDHVDRVSLRALLGRLFDGATTSTWRYVRHSECERLLDASAGTVSSLLFTDPLHVECTSTDDPDAEALFELHERPLMVVWALDLSAASTANVDAALLSALRPLTFPPHSDACSLHVDEFMCHVDMSYADLKSALQAFVVREEEPALALRLLRPPRDGELDDLLERFDGEMQRRLHANLDRLNTLSTWTKSHSRETALACFESATSTAPLPEANGAPAFATHLSSAVPTLSTWSSSSATANERATLRSLSAALLRVLDDRETARPQEDSEGLALALPSPLQMARILLGVASPRFGGTWTASLPQWGKARALLSDPRLVMEEAQASLKDFRATQT